jgi:hypothetical protein
MIFGQSTPSLGEIRLIVIETNPAGIVQIARITEIEISSETPSSAKGLPLVTYDDIGGLNDAIQRIREMVDEFKDTIGFSCSKKQERLAHVTHLNTRRMSKNDFIPFLILSYPLA